MADLIALFALAVLFGGMVFFAAILAPLVFTRLPGEVAGGFIRAVFPVYYLFVLINAALAAVALAFDLPIDAAVMAAVAALTLWLRQGLMPRINRLSDAVKAGDASAKPGFDAGHRLSVILNMAQMLVVAAVLARWALV
ncbi:DUF4149 domain-containing protein [Plastoroseomonas arctica]|uniref:DUF4149 domain-containing protein n=1 Tax=Plastoroseomonas arctica TaxID=1509237 RepID=A0AAF1KI06_9PROT|nr:DUF4149 domain-containing protein [Plastoroseomonas arctica]MBR0654000.1 DUF4149 domain-containing protein [Plastoroseomonas arctica]